MTKRPELKDCITERSGPFIFTQFCLHPINRYIALRQTQEIGGAYIQRTLIDIVLQRNNVSNKQIHIQEWFKLRALGPILPIGLMMAGIEYMPAINGTWLFRYLWSKENREYLGQFGTTLLYAGLFTTTQILQLLTIYPLFKIYAHYLVEPPNAKPHPLTTILRNPYTGIFPFLSTACLDSLAYGALEANLEETKINTFLENYKLARDCLIVTGAALISYPSEVVWRRMVLNGGTLKQAMLRTNYRNGIYAGLLMAVMRNVVSLQCMRWFR